MSGDTSGGDGLRVRICRDLVRLLALLALTVSAALLVNQLWPGPGLCGHDSGCAHVSAGPVGHLLPGIGMLVFGALFVCSFVAAGWAVTVQRCLAVAACWFGVVLILWQVLVIGDLCPYCLVVDGAGMAIAVIELFGNRGRRSPTGTVRARLLWSGAALLAVGLGIGAGPLRSHGKTAAVGGVPPEVRALWVPGKINIVEVADFQCPQCRRMHAVIEPFLRDAGDRVHFELVIAPLARHEQARDAGRAYLCAQELGKGEPMAEELFAARRLQPADCEHIASFLGIPVGSFRACVRRSEIDERLDDNLSWSTAASPNGLPVTWVQERVLFGVQSLQALRQAAESAEQQIPSPPIPGAVGSNSDRPTPRQ
jgi:uncharacterized membrane protein